MRVLEQIKTKKPQGDTFAKNLRGFQKTLGLSRSISVDLRREFNQLSDRYEDALPLENELQRVLALPTMAELHHVEARIRKGLLHELLNMALAEAEELDKRSKIFSKPVKATVIGYDQVVKVRMDLSMIREAIGSVSSYLRLTMLSQAS